MERFGGTPAEVLNQPEYRTILIDLLGKDYRLVGAYRPASVTPLATPITALWSPDDPTVTADRVAPWRDCTTARFEQRTFPGGHFYLTAHLPAVAGLVSR